MCNFATCTIIVAHRGSMVPWTREAWCLLGRFNRLRSKVSNCASLVACWLPSNPSSTCHTTLSSSIQSPLNWRDLWCPYQPTNHSRSDFIWGEWWCQWRLKLPSHSPNMTLQASSRYEQFLKLLIHTDALLSDHADTSFSGCLVIPRWIGRLKQTNW